jgi:hypothetical protein
MLPALSVEASTSALQQLCELKESPPPGSLLSSRIASVFSAQGKPADDIAQINLSAVTGRSRSLHKSVQGLMRHPSVDGRASRLARYGAMSPEAALLLKLAMLERKEIIHGRGIRGNAMAIRIPRGMLDLYIKDNGILTARGKAVIFSDAIIHWMKLAGRKRDTPDVRAFCKLYGMESVDFLRRVTISGELLKDGVKSMTRAGYVFRPVTEQLLVMWLLLRKSSIDRQFDLMMFCRKYALLPCILRRHFYRNDDLNDRGWSVLGISRKYDRGPILDVHRQQWSKLTPDECNQLGYDGFAGIHKIDESAWRTEVLKKKLYQPVPREYTPLFNQQKPMESENG